jgi:hypothetical protein
LILATPTDTVQPARMTIFLEALSQLTELTDQALDEVTDHDAAMPRCPHSGSYRTRILGEYPCLDVL